VSLTREQRAQILFLYHVEACSTVFIAAMTGLGRSTVRRVVEQSSRQEVPEANPMRPQSKSRFERQLHSFLASSVQPSKTVPPPQPSKRPSRRERRHDRT